MGFGTYMELCLGSARLLMSGDLKVVGGLLLASLVLGLGFLFCVIFQRVKNYWRVSVEVHLLANPHLQYEAHFEIMLYREDTKFQRHLGPSLVILVTLRATLIVSVPKDHL